MSAGQDLQLHQLVTALKSAVLAFPTNNPHVIYIDGLDSIVTQKELQFQSLAALMHEAAELNQLFRREARPFKFVVLCRTDIFDRLPGANINKIRQDDSASLNWFDAPGDPDKTRLIRLVNLRAERSLGRPVNVFREFFPPEIDGRDTRTVILDHTRHIPRDLIQILRKLQQCCSRDRDRIAPEEVKAGLRLYSQEYFLPEMRNELAGYLDHDDIERALVLLSNLPRARVSFEELQQTAAVLELGTIDLRGLVRALFDASCLGLVDEAPGRRPHYTFKYRNPTVTMVPGQRMRIHPGALKGLNIEQRSSGRPRDGEPRATPRPGSDRRRQRQRQRQRQRKS